MYTTDIITLNKNSPVETVNRTSLDLEGVHQNAGILAFSQDEKELSRFERNYWPGYSFRRETKPQYASDVHETAIRAAKRLAL